MRWSAGTSGNGSGTPEEFPWSLTRTARSGDRVSLRACSNECGSPHEVTVTTTIFWKGTAIATRSRTDDTRAGHCEPSASIEGNLP
ncbi:MAG TPA: hypothetical protein VMT33_05445 [Candidatus Bathyarchaeia archaeon]|nr:hypothetical protein [Candidatus Bathyarchaeia archaeon]